MIYEPIPEGGGEVARLALERAALLPVGQRGPALVSRRRGNLLAPVLPIFLLFDFLSGRGLLGFSLLKGLGFGAGLLLFLCPGLGPRCRFLFLDL